MSHDCLCNFVGNLVSCGNVKVENCILCPVTSGTRKENVTTAKDEMEEEDQGQAWCKDDCAWIDGRCQIS